jgi:hypothetical protein
MRRKGRSEIMNKSRFYPLFIRMNKGVLVIIAICSVWLITTVSAWASVNKIADAAGILDQNQVRSAGASLQYPVVIYTTQNFSGTSLQFEQRARSHVTNNNMIVMAINTNPGHVTVVAGNAVPLSNSGADSVISSFRNGYQSSGGNYTSATVSALQTLGSVVSTGPVGGGHSRGANPAPASGGGLNGLWCLVGLVILGLLAFFIIKGRRSRGLPFNRPQYNQPYQGNYPPNYGPGYPPQQGGSMNPFAAGGLGAAAGGLLGYELGKERGEHEAREDQGYSGGDQEFPGDPSQYGGGSVGDFGGGDSGGDFGGGSVGDFGGDSGGDFGGGSVGDFGGGSSGSF